MPTQHKVVSAPVEKETYTTGHGEFVVWLVELEDLGKVELHKKPGKEPPAVDMVLLVDRVAEREHRGQKVKRIYLANQQQPANGAGEYDRRPDHPLMIAQRLQTATLSIAPVLIEQMLTLNLEDVQQPTTKAEYLELVKGVAAWAKKTYPSEVLERSA